MRTLHLTEALFVGLSLVLSIAADTSRCSSAERIAGAEKIPYAYNLTPLGASAAAFEEVPFAPDCVVEVLRPPISIRQSLFLTIEFRYPNGLPGVIVAVDAATTRAFAVETRQVFSDVTGEYTDFANGTTIIHTIVVRCF